MERERSGNGTVTKELLCSSYNNSEKARLAIFKIFFILFEFFDLDLTDTRFFIKKILKNYVIYYENKL